MGKSVWVSMCVCVCAICACVNTIHIWVRTHLFIEMPRFLRMFVSACNEFESYDFIRNTDQPNIKNMFFNEMLFVLYFFLAVVGFNLDFQ